MHAVPGGDGKSGEIDGSGKVGLRFVGRIVAGDGGRFDLRLGAGGAESGALRAETFFRRSFITNFIFIYKEIF